MPVRKAVGDFLKRHGLEGCPACIGFSGGADSTALLLALHQCGVPVTACHFHHGLRGEEADADAEWCRRFCETRNIPFLLCMLDVPGNQMHGESCEACGRRLRLAQWKAIAGNRPVFLAHHADDVLEELFLRLARGANASSLVPMKEKKVLYGMTFLRPLLNVRRRDIEFFLKQEGITDWRVDSTNLENDFRRNAVRNRLLPLAREIFGGSDAGFLQAVYALRQDAAYLDASADDAYASGLKSIDAWRQLALALFVRCALRRLREFDAGIQLSYEAVSRLQDAVRRFDGRQLAVPLSGGRKAYVVSEGIAMAPAPWNEQEWNWRKEPVISLGNGIRLSCLENDAGEGGTSESFDAASLPDVLFVRHWREGDRMRPFGTNFSKKLKELFQEARIPRYLRAHLPIVEANGQIIWVPGVKRAEFGRVHSGKGIMLRACGIM